jgi:uncharacterized protein YkwD
MLKLFVPIVLLSLLSWKEKETNATDTCVSQEEIKLYSLIMEYRKQHNLPNIPLSKSLTYVAHQHCLDLVTNKPDLKPGCNAHSWSDKGKWTSCCYTPDHKQAQCMWNKPRELTNYKDNGFEIACGSSESQYDGFVMTAEYALKGWKASVHHNDVILNQSIWKDKKWNAIGVAIYKGMSVVWFGETADAEGKPEVCK